MHSYSRRGTIPPLRLMVSRCVYFFNYACLKRSPNTAMKHFRSVILHTLLTILGLLAASLPLVAQTTVDLPTLTPTQEPVEMAPTTARDQAYADLLRANRVHDDKAALQAMALYTAATMTIGGDSCYMLPPMIENQIKTTRSKAVQALLYSLLGSNYAKLAELTRNRSNDVPLEPFPEDLAKWTRQQFLAKGYEAIKTSWLLADEEPAPITEFSDVITIAPGAVPFFSTLREFTFVATPVELINRDWDLEQPYVAQYHCILNSTPKGTEAYGYWLTFENRFITQDSSYQYWMKLFMDNSHNPSGAWMLLKWLEAYDDIQTVRSITAPNEEFTYQSCSNLPAPGLVRAIEQAENYIKRFPDNPISGSIKDQIARLTSASIAVSLPQDLWSPEKEVQIIVTRKNISKGGTLRVYYKELNDFNSPTTSNYNTTLKKLLKSGYTEVKKFDLSKATPPYIEVDTLYFTPYRSGNYFITTELAGIETPQHDFMFRLCTPIYPITFSADKSWVILTADTQTGQPVKNVSVEGANTTKSGFTPARQLIKTNSEGIGLYQPKQPLKEYTQLRLRKGQNVYYYDAKLAFTVSSFKPERVTTYSAALNTDRAIYHFGDTLKWMAVCQLTEMPNGWNRSGMSTQVLGHERVRIVLKNANYEEIADTTLTTDEYGRVTGQFIISGDGLSGTFSLQAQVGERFIGQTDVTVSDFKLPTFRIIQDKSLYNTPMGGNVTVTGQALTYANAAVANASVKVYAYSTGTWSRFGSRQPKQLSVMNTSTDSAGKYRVVIADSVFAKTSNQQVNLRMIVTAPSGEAHELTQTVTQGRDFTLEWNGNYTFDVADSIKIPIQVIANKDDIAISPTLSYKLIGCDNKVIYEGEINTMHATLSPDWIGGEYRMQIAMADSAACAPLNVNVTIYNSRTGSMPSVDKIFIPNNQLIVRGSETTDLLFGLPEDAYLYMVMAGEGNIFTAEGAEMSAGFHHMSIRLPEGVDFATCYLLIVHDGTVFSSTVNVERKPTDCPVVSVESFRDKLTAGTGEKWRIKFTAGEKAVTDGGVMITGFNEALTSLKYYNLQKPQLPAVYYTPISFNANMALPFESCEIHEGYRYNFSTFNPVFPHWTQTFNSSATRSDGVGLIRFASASNATFEEALDDKVYGLEVTSSAMQEKRSVQQKVGSSKDYAMGNSSSAIPAEEVAESELETTESTDVGTLVATNTPADYRDAEVLQALWQPDLVTDRDGVVTVEFTVPQANTTWQFYSMAWSQDMHSATWQASAVASRPLMVAPNMPSFMRVGDSATIITTVYNTSDSAMTVKSKAEVFDPVTGATIDSLEWINDIAANSSITLGMPMKATATMSLIGLRFISRSGMFSDGEQSAIAVLPASDMVFDSQLFALAPGVSTASAEVPAGLESNSVLQYCANPAWDVIKCLRTGYDPAPTTAPALARALYFNSIARGLSRHYPAIPQMLKKVAANSTDSSLVSQLSKNENLKYAALNSTPWVNAAQSANERMAALMSLLNPSELSRESKRYIDRLLDLQQADGGWKWAAWSRESSRWATANVLCNLGRLNAMGYLDTDNSRLQKAIAKGLDYYYGSITVKTGCDRTATLLKSYFPDHTPTLEADRVIKITINRMLKEAPTASLSQRAPMALVLNANGYSNVARQLLKSVGEYAVSKADGSVYFPALGDDVDAYTAILTAYSILDPESKVLPGVRMWLTMQSQRTSQMGAWDTTGLCEAFVRTSSGWLTDAELPHVTLAGAPVALPQGEVMTGMFTTALPAGVSGELLLQRTSTDVPAWGAVMTRYTATTTDIKAASCNELSIEKAYVIRDSSGRTKYVDRLEKGDRVTVSLTIRANSDLSYLTVIDDRAAGLAPVEQMPGWHWANGMGFYRETSDESTRFYIDYLPRGTYTLSYDLTASIAGEFTGGLARAQSQYQPSITAHSAGSMLTIEAEP